MYKLLNVFLTSVQGSREGERKGGREGGREGGKKELRNAE